MWWVVTRRNHNTCSCSQLADAKAQMWRGAWPVENHSDPSQASPSRGSQLTKVSRKVSNVVSDYQFGCIENLITRQILFIVIEKANGSSDDIEVIQHIGTDRGMFRRSLL